MEPTPTAISRTSNLADPVATPTTLNPIDEKVESIAQDADDLGDWLYNQFFKTIENQVINKTDSQPLTRRSAGQPVQPIPARRYHRRLKKKSKRKRLGKRYKKKGLRRKLLRITEDDSLFHSGSRSDESSSSSRSSSSESDSDSSYEVEKDGHGHRKIIMINKKTTPPLPSFIFLPNVETPFYPPIGLPPPPAVPMYPIVPVPPVGPLYAGIFSLSCNL